MFADDTNVAIASTQAISFGLMRSKGPDLLEHQVAAALADPVAVALVVVASIDEVLRYGLGLDRCDVIVVTPELVAEDAPVVEALARISTTVVMPPDMRPGFTSVIHKGRFVIADSSDLTGITSAVASAMKSP